ncbi:acid phosphatase [Exophiala viscosa]|uniref:acid phosphatase n=1 Tax=Exophiala viscosa TaxID=2486360 RepID=UPI00219E4E0B|nr:acid phosphatase [Exophiala viscosa]
MSKYLTLFYLFLTAASQTALREQVLSTFIYTRYGDRTPLVLSTSPALTPLGAQQLFEAGSKVRDRYVTPGEGGDGETTTIYGISAYQLLYDQLSVLSTTDQYIAASAQAFVQGLYPPLQTSSNWTYIAGQSTLANGTNIVAPLNGYQYPQISTLSSNDLNSIWVNGMDNCPSYTASTQEYYATSNYQEILSNNADFYASLEPQFLNGIFSNASVGYYDAIEIYDYLKYAYLHNSTVAESLSAVDLTRAEILAADLVFALNANVTASGSTDGDHIRAVAGRTLATRLLEAFNTNINNQGTSDQMTLLFGSFEPMVAFAALANIVSEQNAAFYDVPEPGSSFIFEMLSMQDGETTSYPNMSDIYIRFLYQNGTDDFASLVEYPLFGLSPSASPISFLDFAAGLEKFLMYDVADWCTACASFSVFCPAFLDSNTTYSPTTGTVSSGHTRLSLVVAGVIGAVVTLAVAALLLSAVMILGGVRLHRVHTKRRSDLGGFKGGEKLASDRDLSIPKGGAGATVVENGEPLSPHGHERVGSWEMGDPAKAEEAKGRVLNPGALRRPSFEDDNLSINSHASPTNPHDHV